MEKIEITEVDLENGEIIERVAFASIDGIFGSREIERRIYWRLPNGQFVIEESFAYDDDPPTIKNYFEATEWEFFKDIEWNCFERSQ